MCMHQLTLHPNLKHAIERVERPGGSHEGVGRKKNTQFSESIFSQRPASLPFLSAFFAAFPSFTALAFCSHLLFGLFECASPPALLRLFLWLFLSLFPDFFLSEPIGVYGFESYLRTSRESNHHRQSVCDSCAATPAPRGRLFSLFFPRGVSSLLAVDISYLLCIPGTTIQRTFPS